MVYERPSIEREGIDNYLNRTAFEHGGVDWLQFIGFVERGVNTNNLMRAMDLKTRDTVEKYLKLYKAWKKKQIPKQISADKAVDELRNV